MDSSIPVVLSLYLGFVFRISLICDPGTLYIKDKADDFYIFVNKFYKKTKINNVLVCLSMLTSMSVVQ